MSECLHVTLSNMLFCMHYASNVNYHGDLSYRFNRKIDNVMLESTLVHLP